MTNLPSPLHSCFYDGVVVHRRRRPVAHAFRYRLFMAYLDLDETDALLSRRGLFSSRPFSVARFRREDHLGDAKAPLADCVRSLVTQRLGFRPEGPVRLLTNFRTFGFQMNPVSFYFCFGKRGAPEALVAEVSNTPWNERHEYVVDLREEASRRPGTKKEFHVSPFLDMDLEYRWKVSEPGETFSLSIDACDGSASPFDAALSLKRVPWTASAGRRMLVRHPAATMQVFVKIYWQAFRLWLKGVPYVPHPGAKASSAASLGATT